MTILEDIVQQLQKDFPAYKFSIYKGLFEKYIAVGIHGKIPFTIWIDKNSGRKELLDETYFSKPVWWKRRFKTRLFHRSKYQNQLRRDYPRIIMEKLEINLPERKLIRKRLELSLQNMHIINHSA
jgi:hypothetical protein